MLIRTFLNSKWSTPVRRKCLPYCVWTSGRGVTPETRKEPHVSQKENWCFVQKDPLSRGSANFSQSAMCFKSRGQLYVKAWKFPRLEWSEEDYLQFIKRGGILKLYFIFSSCYFKATVLDSFKLLKNGQFKNCSYVTKESLHYQLYLDRQL